MICASDVIHDLVTKAIPSHSYREQWNLVGLAERCKELLGLDVPLNELSKENTIVELEIEERIKKAADEKVAEQTYRWSAKKTMHRAEKAAPARRARLIMERASC